MRCPVLCVKGQWRMYRAITEIVTDFARKVIDSLYSQGKESLKTILIFFFYQNNLRRKKYIFTLYFSLFITSSTQKESLKMKTTQMFHCMHFHSWLCEEKLMENIFQSRREMMQDTGCQEEESVTKILIAFFFFLDNIYFLKKYFFILIPRFLLNSEME